MPPPTVLMNRVPGQAVTALVRAYPTRLTDDAAARAWSAARRQALLDRLDGDDDAALAVSSGCAATGANRHRRALTEQAALALDRLDDGTLVDCAGCGRRLDFDRLDAVPTVIACAACRRASACEPDTRWCR